MKGHSLTGKRADLIIAKFIRCLEFRQHLPYLLSECGIVTSSIDLLKMMIDIEPNEVLSFYCDFHIDVIWKHLDDFRSTQKWTILRQKLNTKSMILYFEREYFEETMIVETTKAEYDNELDFIYHQIITGRLNQDLFTELQLGLLFVY
jgi:hypothetical protein